MPDDQHAGDEVEPFSLLPERLHSLVEEVGLVDELVDKDTEEMFSPVRAGRCIACHAPLGETSIIWVHEHGIVAAYCGGACVQDQAVLGWLMEQYQDLVDNIQFRGGSGDVAPES